MVARYWVSDQIFLSVLMTFLSLSHLLIQQYFNNSLLICEM